ncbi:hypothetical protein HDU76_005520, partial [Blyttiomyces sp. JEL0837]
MQLLHRISTRYDVTLSFQDLFESANIFNMARKIRSAVMVWEDHAGQSHIGSTASSHVAMAGREGEMIKSNLTSPQLNSAKTDNAEPIKISSRELSAFEAYTPRRLSSVPNSPGLPMTRRSTNTSIVSASSVVAAVSHVSVNNDDVNGRVISILRKALGKSDLNVTDDLKNLGFTPRLAADIAVRIKRSLNVAVNVESCGTPMDVVHVVRQAMLDSIATRGWERLTVREGIPEVDEMSDNSASSPIPHSMQTPTRFLTKAQVTPGNVRSIPETVVPMPISPTGAWSPGRGSTIDDSYRTPRTRTGTQSTAGRNVPVSPFSGVGSQAPNVSSALSMNRVVKFSNPDELYPLTPLQSSLYESIPSRGLNLNYPVILRLSGRSGVDVAALQASLNIVSRRHPILRAVLVAGRSTNDIATMKLDMSSSRAVELQTYTLSSKADLNDPFTADSLMSFITSRPFDDVTRRSAYTELPFRAALYACRDAGSHILSIVFNSALVDRVSAHRVAAEVVQVYAEVVTGQLQGEFEDPECMEDPSFVDYATWNANWFQSSPLKTRQIEFWGWKLESIYLGLQLPRIAEESHSRLGGVERRDRVVGHVNLGVSSRMAVHCKVHSVTTSNVLLSALTTLLMRYGAESDVVVAVPVSGRKFDDMDRCIGRFENLVPLRFRLDKGISCSFGDVESVVNRTKIESFENADIPYVLLDEMSTSHASLFEVVFIHNPEIVEYPSLSSTGLEVDELVLQAARPLEADILFTAMDDSLGGLTVSIDFRVDRFPRPAMVAMIKHYERTLEALLTEPEQLVSSFTLLQNDLESLTVQSDIIETISLNQIVPVFRMFEDVAQQYPNKPALMDLTIQPMSFADLNRGANRIARKLRASVDLTIMESKIICLLPRSAGFVMASLAIMKAGAVCVPVDPLAITTSADYVKNLLQQTDSIKIVVESRFRDLVAAVEPSHVLFVDLIGDELSAEDDSNLLIDVGLDAMAYLLCEPGMSGDLRLFARTHQNVVLDGRWHQKTGAAIASDDKVCFTAELSSHLALVEVWAALTSGASLSIFEEGLRGQVDLFMQKMSLLQSTVLFAPTGMWSKYATYNWANSSSLRLVVVYGSGLSAGPWKGCSFAMMSVFAPSPESGICTIYAPQEREIQPPVGNPINSRCIVLDSRKRLIPPMITGELFVAGPGTTPDKYRQHLEPASELVFDQIYSDTAKPTGVLARWTYDGKLEIMGKIGHKAKVDGVMVDLAHVEEVMKLYHDVRDAVVIPLRSSDSLECSLAGYVVPKLGTRVDIDGLSSFLYSKLSHLEVPASFAEVSDGFDYHDSGMVRLSRLPMPMAPYNGQNPPISSAGELMTELEKKLYGIVSSVIGIEEFSVNDNIFHIPGSDQHKCATIISNLRKDLSLPIPMRYLFENPTVRSLSHQIARNQQVLTELSGEVMSSKTASRITLRRDFHTTHLHKAKKLSTGAGRILLQSLGLLFLCIISLVNLAPPIAIIIYLYLTYSPGLALAALPAMYLGWVALSSITMLACKWILIVDRLRASHKAYTAPMKGTPFLNWWFYSLGMKLDRRVVLDTDDFSEFDLITVEEGARIGS